jgi:hypothetical protein
VETAAVARGIAAVVDIAATGPTTAKDIKRQIKRQLFH